MSWRRALGVVAVLAVLQMLPTLAPARGALPLGTVTLTTAIDSSCPAGATCQGFTVSDCPGVKPANGFYADVQPAGPARGTVMFFSGGGGTGWWAESVAAKAMLDQLVADGFRVVQARWRTSWQISSVGEAAGPAVLACQAATLVGWGRDHLYTPAGTGVGECGFCISGQSNGSSQVAYALAFYGLEGVVDGLFPTSGPTYAEVARGCLGEAGYDYTVIGGASALDRSYGFRPPGPCTNHDAAFTTRWIQDGLATGGSDYLWPTTRVHVVEGQNDEYRLHAEAFRDRLVSEGQPVTYELIPGMAHPLNQAGFDALRAAILARPGSSTSTSTTAATTTTTTTTVPGKPTTTAVDGGKPTTTVGDGGGKATTTVAGGKPTTTAAP